MSLNCPRPQSACSAAWMSSRVMVSPAAKGTWIRIEDSATRSFPSTVMESTTMATGACCAATPAGRSNARNRAARDPTRESPRGETTFIVAPLPEVTSWSS